MDNGDGRLRSVMFDEIQADVGFRFTRRDLDAQKEEMIRLTRGSLTREVLALENPGASFLPPNAMTEKGGGHDGVYALWTGVASAFDYGTAASPAGSMDCGFANVELIHLDLGGA